MNRVVTVVSVKTGTETKADPLIVRIELSDGSLFSFKIPYLPPEYDAETLCAPGRDVSAEEAAALRFAASCYRAERAALQLAARAEQTSFGVSRKLEHKGHDSACIRAVIAHLTDLDIISDKRYAELWLRSRIRRGLNASSSAPASPRKLVTGLRGRGIAGDTAQGALKAALDLESELTLLRKYVEKSCPECTGKDPSVRQRLKFEGFSTAALQRFWDDL
jgi:regulatory protein